MRFNELVQKLEKGGMEAETDVEDFTANLRSEWRGTAHCHGNAEVPKGTATDTRKKTELKRPLRSFNANRREEAWDHERKGKNYLIAVYPDENSCHMAKFPDFPELAADRGKDFDDCVPESSRFLDDVIADKVERGKPIPEPTPATEICSKLDSADDEPICIVPVTVYPPSKTKRINVTGKEDVFARIDDFTQRHHLTRFDLMTSSTLEYIKQNS